MGNIILEYLFACRLLRASGKHDLIAAVVIKIPTNSLSTIVW